MTRSLFTRCSWKIDQAIEKISYRTAQIESAEYFTCSPEGVERLGCWRGHHQIDRLVYELYGLTEEEIAIVENR